MAQRNTSEDNTSKTMMTKQGRHTIFGCYVWSGDKTYVSSVVIEMGLSAIPVHGFGVGLKPW